MFNRPELNNEHYDDCYFSYLEGLDEALYVYIQGTSLPKRIGATPFSIGETGFGTGLNLIALIVALEKAEKRDWKISFYTVEKYPLSPKRIMELFEPFIKSMEKSAQLFLEEWQHFYPTLTTGWNNATLTFGSGEVTLSLYYGDVDDFMKKLDSSMDAWFLDGHSPDKNPDMWQDSVIQGVGSHAREGCEVATFTSAGFVRRGLRDVGFTMQRIEGFGGKRHMIIGKKSDLGAFNG